MTAPLLDLRTLPPEQLSIAERLALCSPEERERVLGNMVDEAYEALRYDWQFWGRPEQQEPPEGWAEWWILGGRGSGKTRPAAEATRRAPERHARIAIIGATAADVRDYCIEGPSGLLAITPRHERPVHEPSKRRLTWPNGAQAITYAASEPEALRGFEGSFAWCDEFCKWRYPKEAIDNLNFGMRAGRNPQRVYSTTPKPTPLFRKLLARVAREQQAAARQGRTPRRWQTRMSTYRNLANLAADFIADMLDLYEGTRLGEQELHGVVLEDVEGALWKWAQIEAARWHGLVVHNRFGFLVPAVDLARVVVGVDPAGGGRNSTGIVVVGSTLAERPEAFVLDDRTVEGRDCTPTGWGRAAIRAYVDYEADAIVVERNYGGDMARNTIESQQAHSHGGRDYPPGSEVRIRETVATRGKQVRAEPVQGLYEQRSTLPRGGASRVHHVGRHPLLESQQTTWVPGEAGALSPDRVDALVWAVNYAVIERRTARSQGAGEQIAAARIPTTPT